MIYILTASLSFIALFTFIKLVDWLGLKDYPCERKQHDGVIPVIGGLSVFTSFFVSVLFFTELTTEIYLLMIASSLMVYIGVLDDKYDLSVRSRLIGQFIVSSILIMGLGNYLTSLGNIFYFFELELGIFGIVLTYILIIGIINAFNMIDGIDGLLGSVSFIAFSGLAVLSLNFGHIVLFQLCLLFVSCLVPFLLANLQIFPFKKNKVFMGDAGSMFIGFVLVWLLVTGIELNKEETTFRPVVALFLLGLPLIDMVAIMYRRIKKKASPFKADRDHIHHIFMRAGFSSKETLFVISLFALIVAAGGVVMEICKVHEAIMFCIFILIFIAYSYMLSHAWKFSRFIQNLKKKMQ